MMKVIVTSSIAVAIVILMAVTFTQEAKMPDSWGSNVSLPLTKEPSGTPDEVDRGSQTSRPIEEVKQAWEKQLMAMPGVMGVGIGLTKDGRQKAIKVYVDRRASAQAAQIPRQIEGYPVEVELRGTFRPLK